MRIEFSLPALCAVTLAVVACGGGDGAGDSAGNGNGLPIETSSRVKTISFDYSRNETIDRIETYFYDDLGRVSRIEFQDLESTPAVTTTRQYEYSDDGLIRVSESDTGDERVISYQNGRVAAISDSDGDQQTFRYDSGGRLIEDMENDPVCDDFSVAAEGDTTRVYDYTDGRLSSIDSTDGAFTSAITYNAQSQLQSLLVTENCGDDFDESDELTISYDSLGLVTSLEQRSFSGSNILFAQELTSIERDDQGRVSRIVERDVLSDTVFQTRNREYNDDGLPIADTLVFNSPSQFFVMRDTTITFSYEDASCVVSYSVNPSRLAIIDALLPSVSFAEEDALLCGYLLD